jgi:hypothetical protein
MAVWMVCRPRRAVLHGGSCLAAIAMLAVMAGESVVAQPLTDPRPRPKYPTAKPLSAERMKPCSAFGAGFVQVPGSDICIKIGGFAEGEIGSR